MQPIVPTQPDLQSLQHCIPQSVNTANWCHSVAEVLSRALSAAVIHLAGWRGLDVAFGAKGLDNLSCNADYKYFHHLNTGAVHSIVTHLFNMTPTLHHNQACTSPAAIPCFQYNSPAHIRAASYKSWENRFSRLTRSCTCESLDFQQSITDHVLDRN